MANEGRTVLGKGLPPPPLLLMLLVVLVAGVAVVLVKKIGADHGPKSLLPLLGGRRAWIK